MSSLAKIASCDDFRRAAKRRLPRILFDYIDGGSYAETTLKRNVEAFEKIELRQRVMIDVSKPRSAINLFGQSLRFPCILAPVGFAGMFAKRGEVQAARAAHSFGTPFCLSTLGICSIEEVTTETGTPPWFQLYMIKDRGVMAELLQRATSAGCPVLVLTADLQTPGARYRDIRSGLMRPPTATDWAKRTLEGMLKFHWTHDVYITGRPHSFGNLNTVLPKAASFYDAWRWIGENFDASLTWRDLDFIRQHWSGPIVLKGVMTPEDAKLAEAEGIDGLVVSNHGGRQLDGSPASIDVVGEIRRSVAQGIPVLCDSGIQSGLSILKSRRAGAQAAMVGRAWAYALAAAGEAGVSRLLTILENEYRTAQMLTADFA